MALFDNQTTSSLADLVSKLNTFLSTGGGGNPAWLSDRHVAGSGEWAMSKAALGTNTGDIQVAFQWDTGTPNGLAIYQYDHASGAGNYNAARAGPWDQDNDSGNGFAGTTDASILTQRHADIGNTPVQYWCFVSQSPVEAVHVVVQVGTSGNYVHFGWGELSKYNDWNGGAYAYGQRMQGVFNNNQAVQLGSTFLMDGLTADGGGAPNPSNGMELYAATVQCDALPQQAAGGMWAVAMGNQSDLGQDRQSNGGGSDTDRALFVGAFRGNSPARDFGQPFSSPQSGFVNNYPMVVWYWNRSPSTIYGPVGVMQDVRGVHIKDFAPQDEVVIGGDTWVIFPSARRTDVANEVGASVHQGIMYKKN